MLLAALLFVAFTVVTGLLLVAILVDVAQDEGPMVSVGGPVLDDEVEDQELVYDGGGW